MKRNYISQLRYCEKIKESQSFKQADGLQKKVRKRFKWDQNIKYDAQKELRQIMCFWKQSWESEHYHPVFINPKVYYPIVTISDPSQQTKPQLKKYAQIIKKLIERLRTDQQIEVNYKIQERKYLTDMKKLNPIDPQWKYFKMADISNQSLLKKLSIVTKAMIQSVNNSLQQIDNHDYFLDTDQTQKISQIKSELLFTDRIFNRHIQDFSNFMQQKNNSIYMAQTVNMKTFVGNVISVLDEMKLQCNGPSFISIQPQIGELTYLLHPILWAVNALFHKQQVQIKKVKKFNRQFYQPIPYTENQTLKLQQLDEIQIRRSLEESKIWEKQKQSTQPCLLYIKDNFKQQRQNYSRVVFLNLDGYESEYNLEVAKNFSQNLMYISFPKFLTADKKFSNAYEDRFYNKIMFEKTKLGQSFSDNQELNFLLKQQKLTKSPEQYHQNIEKLYKQYYDESDKMDFMSKIDRNEKIFIFPIKMNCLFDKHHDEIPHQYESRNSEQSMMKEEVYKVGLNEQQSLGEYAQQNESHFIRFVMRRYMNSQILKFKPSHVIISYSNRIVLEDSHFVEMIQELTKVANNKVMLFPNFTTSYIHEIVLQTSQKKQLDDQKNEEIQPLNCYAISNARLLINSNQFYNDPSLISKGYDQCPMTLSFFSKLMRFLKISSGTYNLQQNFDNQSLASKLKNVKIYPYVQFLFSILSQEYTQLSGKIDPEMLKADKYLLEQRLRQEKQNLKKCIPKFYTQLFKMLELLVVHGVHGDIPLEKVQNLNQSNKQQGIPPSIYTIDVRRVFQYFTNIKDKQGMKRIRNLDMQRIKKPFNEFILFEQKEKMDSRYQQQNHMYFKIRPETQEYQNATQLGINLKSSNSGLRIVTFKLAKNNNLPIYKDTSIVYETNQIGKQETFILVMNHLGLNDEVVKHYIGKLNITDKPKFSHQNCTVESISFYQGTAEILPQKFKAKCEWNFKQTQQYMILYWPSEYDFLKASLLKMIKEEYEPRISHQIYIAKKRDYTKFYKVQIVLDTSAASILPRRGCSAYNFKNKVFIFGGVYERQFNYLNLQHDIVAIDLDDLDPTKQKVRKQQKMIDQSETLMTTQNQSISLQNCRLILTNIKNQLYSEHNIPTEETDVKTDMKTDVKTDVKKESSVEKRLNSFIRPKIEIQFFQATDICTAEISSILNQGQIRTVIMIGGYGQNFMFPHSLITYFYHIIRFNILTRQIVSIQKRNVIDRPIPINVKELIKNKHIFRHFHIYQNETLSQGLTRQDHYFFHRVVYNIKPCEKNKNDLDFNFKFIFMYATELYNEFDKNFLSFAQKIGEKRVIEQSEGTKVQIVNGCNNNLFITNQDGTFLYSLNYKAYITSMTIISLTHEAILSLDVNSSIVCALIKHKQHTKGKCVIASQKIQLPNPKFAFQNQNHYINLIKFKQFDQNFQLHALFMMKRNQLIIVHGVSFYEYDVYDQIISTKYTKFESLGEITKQRSPQIQTPSVSLKIFYDCTSFLARENQKIFTLNFMTHQSKQQEYIYGFEKYSMDMNSQKKQWKAQFSTKFVSFYIFDGFKQVYLGKVRFIQARQVTQSKLSNSTCIISPMTPLSLSMNQYSFNLDKLDNEPKFIFKQKQIIKVKVQQVSQKETWPRISWKKIYKNQQLYQDSELKVKIIPLTKQLQKINI